MEQVFNNGVRAYGEVLENISPSGSTNSTQYVDALIHVIFSNSFLWDPC